jgi:hypothetical protein
MTSDERGPFPKQEAEALYGACAAMLAELNASMDHMTNVADLKDWSGPHRITFESATEGLRLRYVESTLAVSALRRVVEHLEARA